MTHITKERVRVRLRVRLSPEVIREAALQSGKYFLAVTGPGLQLGFYDHNRASRMTTSEHDIWTKDLWITKNTPLTYNYLVIHRYTNETLHCEKIAAREIYVGVTPLTIENIYSRVQLRFNNSRFKQRSRPNTSWKNTRPQNKLNARSEYHEDKAEGHSTKEKHGTNSALYPDDCGGVANVNEVKTKAEVSSDTVPVVDIKGKVFEVLSAQTAAHTYTTSTVEDDVECEIQHVNCQLDGVNNIISVSNTEWRYAAFAGKVGLVAVAAFGFYKLLLAR